LNPIGQLLVNLQSFVQASKPRCGALVRGAPLALTLAGAVALACGCVTQKSDAGGAVDAGPDSGIVSPAVPFHTESRFILDANNQRFKLAGVSWYGGESPDLVPLGLDHADVNDIARLIRQLGFNSVRLPWAMQLYEENPAIPDAMLSANPALQGKTALEVFDAVVDALAGQGLVVVLDNHRSRGDWCCDTAHGDGLWHTVAYPETSFIADWQAMAARYQSQPAVIGADLRNELRGQLIDDAPAVCTDCDTPANSGCTCLQPSWGDGNALTDWAAAATRAGNAVLGVNPDLLIIVEGDFWSTWIGANGTPVTLSVPNRLVYSAHNYSSSNGGVASFATYAAFKAALDSSWGYVVTAGQTYTAPMWVGEFGTNHTTPSAVWWPWIQQYLAENDFDWCYWAVNGTEGSGYGRAFGAEETFGVLDTTWTAPASSDFLAALQALAPAVLTP
jgi:endoglucanase